MTSTEAKNLRDGILSLNKVHPDAPGWLLEAAIKAEQLLAQAREAEALEAEGRWMKECSITVCPRITQLIDDVVVRVPITHLDRWRFRKPEDVIELVVERATKFIRSTNPKL